MVVDGKPRPRRRLERALEPSLASTTLSLEGSRQGGVVRVQAQAEQVQLVEALLGAADSLDLGIDHGVDLDAKDDGGPVVPGAPQPAASSSFDTGERVVVGDRHEGGAPGAHLLVELERLEDPVRAGGMGVQIDGVAPKRGHTSMMRLMRSMLWAAPLAGSMSMSTALKKTGPDADRETGGQAVDEPRQDGLRLEADDAVERAGHTQVADVGGAAREHALVGCGHVRVGAHDGTDAAVEMEPEGRLLAGQLAVEVDQPNRRQRVGALVEQLDPSP